MNIPSDAEWIIFIDYWGGLEAACAKLKETGSVHWNSHGGGINESGFTDLPVGLRWGTMVLSGQ